MHTYLAAICSVYALWTGPANACYAAFVSLEATQQTPTHVSAMGSFLCKCTAVWPVLIPVSTSNALDDAPSHFVTTARPQPEVFCLFNVKTGNKGTPFVSATIGMLARGTE